MNINIKNTLLINLFLSGFGYSVAVAQQAEPDAIYLEQSKEYTLNADGSWNYQYSHKLKLLTYYAINTLYGEDFILYNPDFQKLKINHSITTMSDGTIVPAPDNAFNELLPGFAANAPAYNHLREMAVTHTGLDRGAVEDFSYTLSSSKDFTSALTGNEVLWMNSPVEKLTFTIHIPANAKLNIKQFNIIQKPIVTKSGNQTTYCWTLNNLPANTREDFRPRELQNRPRIVFSTEKKKNKLVDTFLNQAAFEEKSDDKIKKTVHAVRKEQINDLAVMVRLQDMVANEVNYQAVPLSLSGYRVRSCNETYAGNGGTELEKAVLLSAMIESAGIKACPVALIPERYFDKKSFNFQLAEKFLVKATDARGETYYFSPLQTDLQDQQFFLNGKSIIPLIKGKPLQADKEQTQAGELEIAGNCTLNKKMEFTGTISISLSNRLNPYLKLSQDTSYAVKLMNGMIETAKIDKFSIDRMDKDNTLLQYKITTQDMVKEQAGHYFLKMPFMSAGADSWHMTELVTARTEPLEIPFPVKESYRYTITLPEGYELITEESSLSLKKDFGSLNIHISQEGRTLQVDRMIHLTKTVIEPSEYADFKAFINTWNNKKYREVILRIGPK
jgi:hypothetical protein